MSDETRPPDSPDDAAAELDELSDAELDAIIAEKDPNFFNEMNSLSQEKFAVPEIKEEEKVPRLQKLTAFKDRVIAWVVATSVNFAFYCKTTVKDAVLSFLKSSFLKTKAGLTHSLQQFGKLSTKKKVALLGLVAASVGIGWLANKARLGQLIQPAKPLFAVSMQDFSDQVYTWDPKGESTSFYNNPSIRAQLHLLKKITVNLKRLPTTEGKNPMGVFEFFVEGLSAEALIEIKENESRIRDHLSRAIEEFSVEELQTPDGKQALLLKLRDSLNAELKQGLVKRLYFKNIILNPY